jgi:hypothetical protein
LLPRQHNSRLYAWWYFTIALGFLLLAINQVLVHAKLWLIGLRVVIALGFAALGYLELRTHTRPK